MFYVWLIYFVCFLPSPRSHIKVGSPPFPSVTHIERDVHTSSETICTRFFLYLPHFSLSSLVDLPPSLSFPSEQSVSVATSQPSPRHPDWQMQCQTFWSRTQRPLLLHSPGQPSVKTSTCMSESGHRFGRSKGQGSGVRGSRHDRRHVFCCCCWVNVQYDTPLTGLGDMGKGEWAVTVVSHEFCLSGSECS